MKASEITIGSIVQYRGRAFSVESFDGNLAMCAIKDCSYPSIVLNRDTEIMGPIPITRELLVKNGFVDISDNNGEMVYRYIDDTYVALLWTDNGIRFRTEDSNLQTQSQAFIKYVHQLQNMLTISGLNLEIRLCD